MNTIKSSVSENINLNKSHENLAKINNLFVFKHLILFGNSVSFIFRISNVISFITKGLKKECGFTKNHSNKNK